MESSRYTIVGASTKIEEWEHDMSVERTRRLRPDLLEDE